jgi:hypothetical protein
MQANMIRTKLKKYIPDNGSNKGKVILKEIDIDNGKDAQGKDKPKGKITLSTTPEILEEKMKRMLDGVYKEFIDKCKNEGLIT